MPDATCGICPEHSGIESRNTVIVWMLGILITLIVVLGGYLAAAISDIRTQISTVPLQYQQQAERNREMKEELKEIKSRLAMLESRTPDRR